MTLRLLTIHQLRDAQGFPEGHRGLHELSEATRRRIREGERRFLQPCEFSIEPLQPAPYDPRPRVKLRMIVKQGVHVGYQVFTEVAREYRSGGMYGTYEHHHYQWFEPAPAPSWWGSDLPYYPD